MDNLMSGKTCMVTGANSGIGKAFCSALASHGAKVIMVCRNEDRGTEAKNRIKEETGNYDINLLVIDLSSQRSIRNGVEGFKNKYAKLDVLVNNAGALIFKKVLTEDGIESNLAVNYLAPFLLTALLIDVLKSSAPSRIINVVSEGTSNGRIDLDNILSDRKFNPILAYSQAKQAEIFFTFELARRLKGTKVTANCFYPGLVNTNLGNVDKGFLKMTHRVMTVLLKPMFTPVDDSVKIGMYLAASMKAENITGKYLKREKDRIKLKSSYDMETSTRLWELGEKLAEVKYGF
jgi:NAD(P)-dependent dehydrogenase (short-subunit alcohol dehydrogenase family)